MRLLSELANYQVRFLWVGDTSHTFTAGVWNIRIVKDGEDVKPSLAVQVKKFSKGQGKTCFFPFCLIWIFTHIEKCQGHHTRETIAIHHFTSNRLRLHRRVNAKWPPNSSCSSSAVRRLKFSRLSFFKSLSLVGDQTWPERQRHWFITLPCRPNDQLAAIVTYQRPFVVPSRPVGFSWVLYELMTERVWVSWRFASEGGKKNFQMPFLGCDGWKFRGGFEQPNGMFAERINRWVSRLLFC